MPSLLTLRAGPASWQLDAIPHAYEEAGRTQFAAMPGVLWVRDARAPNGRGFYRGDRVAVEAVARTLAAAGVVRLARPATAHPLDVLPLIATELPLREYQIAGAAWIHAMLRNTGAALLGDEMGIGKSAQALAALDATTAGAVLIVCPAIVVPHWHAQIARWGRSGVERRVLSYEGFQRAAAGGSKKIPALAPEISAVVFDEIHYLSNSRSARSRAASAWLHAQTRRPPVIGLSGTPMQARPRDLWHVLDLLWPGRFGSWWSFTKRYADGHYEEIPHVDRAVWKSDGASRGEELAARLGACMLRRTKADVLAELPPRTRTVLEIEIPAGARKSLARAARAIDWRARRGQGVSALLGDTEAYKADAACGLAREIVDQGGRVLVLTTRRATADAIATELHAPCVKGDTPPNARAAQLQASPIGVATIYSVTTGIDLVAFDHIVFTGLDWLPSVLLQAEARIHRIGQRNPCVIYYLCARGTIDEVIRSRVIDRLDVIARTLGSGDELGLRDELAGGETEEELLAAIVSAVGTP